MRYSQVLNDFRRNYLPQNPHMQETDNTLVNPHQLLNEDNPFCSVKKTNSSDKHCSIASKATTAAETSKGSTFHQVAGFRKSRRFVDVS